MAEQLTGLADDRALLGRTSTAERVSDILRSRIAEGYFPPGTRLSEDSIGGALGVSRNTLRESFRLLTHERLLVHELNRGVFVRVLTVEDVEDIYRTRSLVECAVVRGLGEPPYPLDGLAEAVEDGRRSAREGDWKGVGTANIHFHRELVALAGSERTDELMRSVFAELRLAFHVVDDPGACTSRTSPGTRRSSRRWRAASGRRRRDCWRSTSRTRSSASWRSTCVGSGTRGRP